MQYKGKEKWFDKPNTRWTSKNKCKKIKKSNKTDLRSWENRNWKEKYYERFLKIVYLIPNLA